MITLKPITKDNWRDVCVKLSLEEEQKNFVAPNWYSVLEGIFNENFVSRAVYAGEELVGYTLYGLDAETNQWWIIRLMTDKNHQHKGYGRATMLALIETIRAQPGCDAIYISFEPENDVARKLYASLQFEDTGKIEHGEVVYRLWLG